MSSGIQVKDEIKEIFEDMKLRRKYSHIIFRISTDKKNIEIDSLGEMGETFDMFYQKMCAAAENGHARYAALDFASDNQKGSKASRIVFVMCVPDSLSIKEKMLYSSSKRALTTKLSGIYKEIQCNDLDEINVEAFTEKCMSKYQ